MNRQKATSEDGLKAHLLFLEKCKETYFSLGKKNKVLEAQSEIKATQKLLKRLQEGRPPNGYYR
ncbi:hypothetical protein JGUZn3_12320 [Entomobacter blattae]|uniref:Uncharacterized protein n=1 Tax=Entomobacter blattae TaxID=2762277 RepID=A0A7H1NRP8_9PROT|nr:hypothetical protein JGUZn3_12320 [Entomobacter blattae]